MTARDNSLTCLCGNSGLLLIHTYHSPPPPENKYQFSSGDNYHRELYQCENCGHYQSVHNMDASSLYAGDYVDATYGDGQGLKNTFERIIALPPEKSDNQGRVKRIIQYAESFFPAEKFTGSPPAILDVGSGLCVFLHLMKKAGWDCTALDTDERQISHARDVAGVNAIYGSFADIGQLRHYDLITFNKVLEHFKDPITMLGRSRQLLADHGFVYIELPDGETAMRNDGPKREEFTIDHYHIFGAASVAVLCGKAGFSLQRLERLQEPSGKYTLWACLTPR